MCLKNTHIGVSWRVPWRTHSSLHLLESMGISLLFFTLLVFSGHFPFYVLTFFLDRYIYFLCCHLSSWALSNSSQRPNTLWLFTCRCTGFSPSEFWVLIVFKSIKKHNIMSDILFSFHFLISCKIVHSSLDSKIWKYKFQKIFLLGQKVIFLSFLLWFEQSSENSGISTLWWLSLCLHTNAFGYCRRVSVCTQGELED